jgi:hypothetical protein
MRDQLFTLFLCPNCNKYTIHGPRLTHEGRWMVDHMLVERMFYNGVMVTVPYNWCEITAQQLVSHESFTRTVIRV